MKQQNNNSESDQKSLESSRGLAVEIARLCEDRHCEDIVILELADTSPVAKHFVICTGTSTPQIRSLARESENLGQEKGFVVFGRAGFQQGQWAIVDFVDVVVHIFDREYRNFYDLELLWGDAPKIDFSR